MVATVTRRVPYACGCSTCRDNLIVALRCVLQMQKLTFGRLRIGPLSLFGQNNLASQVLVLAWAEQVLQNTSSPCAKALTQTSISSTQQDAELRQVSCLR
jgi:hypothetical protein